ncbi:cytochrome P450 [Melanogaster broomeanus]|nr:cytochrome P450 [Melanogaster broomeanus]
MQLQVPLPDNVSGSLACIVVAASVITLLSKPTKLDTIPTVGSTTWLGSWWAGIKFVIDGIYVIQEGYDKHKAAPFKVATLHRWLVVVSGSQYLEDIARRPDDELSAVEAANDSMKVEHTLGHDIYHNPYHTPIIRSQLVRNIGTLYPDIRDEVVTALEDILDLKDNEWKSVPAVHTIERVLCRTINRVSVGLPLCRNPDWVDLGLQFTLDVLKGAMIIGLFPIFMAPLVGQFMTSIPGDTKHGMEHLGPIIEERQKCLDKYGTTWADKPICRSNDLLSWLMDKAEGSERTVKSLTKRILAANFAAICTSSNIFTQVLYNLAANPQYIQPLREEVESIVETAGWSKAALGKMRKIDSFLKESQRIEGLGSLSMLRKTMKDLTLSDGTFLPGGTTVVVASRPMHLDNELYENAHLFDPFRFANMRDEDGGFKHQLVSTNPQYLAFGHGRHACPGRFYAASVLKTMLAHIVVSYDIKLEDGVTRPKSLRVGPFTIANRSAKVMFRKRVL